MSRNRSETDGFCTGAMWECPQLFRIGDDWALVVSVWDDDRLYYVAGAIGAYNGTTFTPERWSRITHDETAYAMTSFTDRAGLPCVMSWLREDPGDDAESRPWVGALSLPMVAEVGPGRSLQLRPHPDVDALRCSSPLTRLVSDRVEMIEASKGLDLELPVAHDEVWELQLHGQSSWLLTMHFVCFAVGLVVNRPTGLPMVVPVSDDRIRIVIDSGLVEIFSGNGSAAFRVPATSETTLAVTGSDLDRLRCWRLSAVL